MDGKSLDITQEKLLKLKELLPEAFTDGKVDCEKLRDIRNEIFCLGPLSRF